MDFGCFFSDGGVIRISKLGVNKLGLNNKLITVVGLSKRTGVEAVKFLLKKGAEVIATDVKSASELSEELEALSDYEVTYNLGGHDPQLILESELIVISPGVPIGISILEKARAQGIEVISEIELAYRFSKAPILAVTGTNGKTTTTTLLGEIFAKIKRTSVVGGNIGRALIKDLPQLESTGIAIAEVSSFQLEGVKKFSPYISLVLNITPDHLKRHGDFSTYQQMKRRLVAAQRKDDYAVLNYDDQLVREFSEHTKAEVIYFSRQEELERGVFLQGDRIISTLENKKEEIIPIKDVAVEGPHNIENVLGALTSSLVAGVDKKVIKEVLEEFRGVEHRIEEVEIIDGVRYINDSKATNPVSAIKALKTFSKPIILIGGGMDKESDFAEWAQLINNKVKELILLGETAEKIKNEVEKLGYANIHQVANIKQAVDKAFELAKSGEVVLLSPGCASWDMFDSYKERGRLFREAVKELRRG